MSEYSLPIRVYYEDTDSGGVVYYANYLKFIERGRTELLRGAGFENTSLREKDGVLFVVRRVEADYLKSAFLDDLLSIGTRISEIGRASLTMEQEVRRGEDLLFSARVKLACVGAESLKPVAVPAGIRAVFGPGL